MPGTACNSHFAEDFVIFFFRSTQSSMHGVIMQYRVQYLLLLTVSLLVSAIPASSMDYVRLRNGKIIEGAILRQDTLSLFITDWDSRQMRQPPIQVFTREEVESVWFVEPKASVGESRTYRPHSSGTELGGDLCFQTWAESGLPDRRYLLQTTLHGGYSITKALGIEADFDLSYPFGSKSDTTWHKLDAATQVSLNVVAHPFIWNDLVPYALLGGGAAQAIPMDHVMLISSTDTRAMVNIGLGVKWGKDGIGIRAEWRHSFYSWQPDKLVTGYRWVGADLEEYQYRAEEQNADASVFKIGLFFYH
jgi:hypothetical protein